MVKSDLLSSSFCRWGVSVALGVGSGNEVGGAVADLTSALFSTFGMSGVSRGAEGVVTGRRGRYRVLTCTKFVRVVDDTEISELGCTSTLSMDADAT